MNATLKFDWAIYFFPAPLTFEQIIEWIEKRQLFAIQSTGDRGQPVSITCPKCGWTSYNLNDVQNKYCGHCHEFWDEKKTKERTV